MIDPQYLSHDADTVLREGLKLARKLGNTAPLSSAIGDEVTPGSSVQSDDDWDKWLANVIVSVSCVAVPVAAAALLARQRPRAGAVYVQSVVDKQGQKKSPLGLVLAIRRQGY